LKKKTLLPAKKMFDCDTVRVMREAYYSSGRPRTAVSTVFWSDENMRYVIGQIESFLTEFAEMPVSIELDTVFFNICCDLCGTASNLVNVQSGLDALNQAVVSDVVYSHQSSIRQRKLFMKWAIHGDRDQFLAPPMDTHGRKRIIRPTTQDYMVQHNPNSRYFQEFQDRINARRPYWQYPLFDKVMGKPCAE
jgi:hypothetical protein